MVAALAVGVITRRRRAVPVLIVGSAALLLLGIAFVLEGARPQLVAAALAAVLGAAVLLWVRSRRAPRLATAGSVLVAFGAIGIAGAAWALPPMSVPVPTGQYAVGLTSHVWTDSTRDAHGGSIAGQQRSLPVTIWYPAARPGPHAAYLPHEDKSASALPKPSLSSTASRRYCSTASSAQRAMRAGKPVPLRDPFLSSLPRPGSPVPGGSSPRGRNSSPATVSS